MHRSGWAVIHSQIQVVRIYPLSIPMRRRFAHAAAARQTAEPVVVGVELRNGVMGYGETLPREYVTGETVASVLEDIAEQLLRGLERWRPASFAEAIELIEGLPEQREDGGLMLAARAALELALLDAYSRLFGRPIADVAGWLGLPRFGPPGSTSTVRYTAPLGADAPQKVRASIRKMRWFGLRDFKLKVGDEDDDARVRAVVGALGASLGRKTTLRVDANMGWTVAQAVERLKAWSRWPIACVEQPLPVGMEAAAPALREAGGIPIMYDESLLTYARAEAMLDAGEMDALNIRLSKNGGLLPAMRLAGLARKRDAMFQLGCMVGETSILSAAGRRFLECVPGAAFAEGSYGRFLLAEDVAGKSLTFGWGGRPKPLAGAGWGIDVDAERLRTLTPGRVIEYRL
jgi:L-alanine-DL-glutamate epimerase-like enolase superfamily enzyme